MAVRTPDQRQYGRPATGPPLCKGSCRRTPTEGLAEYRRWQPVLPVRCPDGQAVLPHPVKQPSKMMQSASQSPLHGFAMLSPLCTRGAVASRRGGEPPLPNCAAALENRIDLGLHPGICRCWLASAGAGRQTTHTAWESFGSSVTLVGKLHSFGAGFFPSPRLAREGREGL